MGKQVKLTALVLVLMALVAGCIGFGSSPAPAALKVEPTGTLDFGDDKDELHLFIDNSVKKTLEWSVIVVGADDWLEVERGCRRGNFNVGDVMSYRVQAVGAAGTGDVSDADTGVIIAPQQLVNPADGSEVPPEPWFKWEQHRDATAYGLYVARDNRANHVWQQNFHDGTTTEARYPGDDPHLAPELAPGEYLWYVAAGGPVVNGKVASVSVSADWTFFVVNGED